MQYIVKQKIYDTHERWENISQFITLLGWGSQSAHFSFSFFCKAFIDTYIPFTRQMQSHYLNVNRRIIVRRREKKAYFILKKTLSNDHGALRITRFFSIVQTSVLYVFANSTLTRSRNVPPQRRITQEQKKKDNITLNKIIIWNMR